MAATLVRLLALNALLHLFPTCYSMNTIVVDGLAEWKKPTLRVGDSLVLRHENLQNVYLFNSRRAFDHCIFSQATIVYKAEAAPSSAHFTWHPSRPGYYYFSSKDRSTKGCEDGEKVPVRVIAPHPSISFPPLAAPPPTAGGDLFSPPSHGGSVSSSPSNIPDAPSPSLQPEINPSPSPDLGGGIPFINSNPAVPLPTGETDTATIQPLPTPGVGTQVVGLGTKLRVGMALVFVMLSSMLFFWVPM